MKNDGFTLVELIVSICLISIVMFFMYNLLDDIKFEGDNDFIAMGNVASRVEIEDYIHERIFSVSEIGQAEVNGNRINFTNSEYSVVVEENILKFYEGTNLLRKWNLANAKYKTEPECNTVNSNDEDKMYGFVECTIKVFTNNPENNEYKDGSIVKIDANNTLDDIVISYMYTKI